MVHSNNIGRKPEILFKDRVMLITIVLWTVLIVLILYSVPDMIIQFMEGIR